ncbi:MAG: diguanylate cyclase [Lachnospiraceae bacterium]|nr:diguanylate cyclase [Lachnospiraceae bacterium]
MSYNEYNEQVQGWIRAVMENRGVQAKKVIQNCKWIEQYATQINDEKLLGLSYFYTGETHYLSNDIERLFRYIIKSLGYLERSGQWKLAARAYNLLAITSISRGNVLFALDYYLNGLSYCKKFRLYEEGCIININIGTLYINSGEYKQAKMFFEDAFRQLRKIEGCSNYTSYKMAIYLALGKCYMSQEVYEKARQYMQKAERECLEKADALDKMYFTVFQTLYFNVQGKIQSRDECIQKVQKQMTGKFALLDVFDELYDYSKMLFEIRYYKEFWEVITLLEEFVSRTKIINFQRKLLSLKIQYYKLMEDNNEYLQAAGVFYELSELMETENSYMVSAMLDVRRSLDSETKMRLEMEKENVALVELSQTDALTGLWNRFRMNTYAEEAFEKAREQKSNFAVEILDVDYFKQYNDTYGHQAGDKCLIHVANEIKKLQEHGGINGFRYGGDEFVILFEGYNMEQVGQLMQDLKLGILKLQLTNHYSQAAEVVSISQGACVGIPGESSRVWDFLQTADKTLYQVKRKSRNNLAVELFQETKNGH